jgi:hypothetical protein
MKHTVQKADYAEYAIALELACGARIGELLWKYVTIVLKSHCTPYPKSLTLTLTLTLCGLRSEFEETHDTPEHLKQVRNYNCVKLVQSVSISVSVPVSISVSPLLTTLSPNRLEFQRGVQEEVSPKSQKLLKGVRIVESPKPQTQIRLG